MYIAYLNLIGVHSGGGTGLEKRFMERYQMSWNWDLSSKRKISNI